MPEISKIKLTSGDEYNIKDTTAREMISSHTHTNGSMGFGYGTCDTAASTTDKTVSISNYNLTNGGIVSIKFDYDVPANATLNINSKGAKSIYYKGSTITDDIIKAGDTATFIYDGTNYNLISLDRDFDFNENSILKCDIKNSTPFGNTLPISTSMNLYTLNNIKYKVIIATFDFYVYRASTINQIPIYYNNSVIQNDIIYPGDTATFIYDGTNNRYELINIDTKIDNDRIIIPYAKSRYFECTTDSATLAKSVSTNNSYNINENYIISVKFTNDVPANATLNINNNGDKPIYNNGSAIRNNVIKANDNVIFIYDGSKYKLMRNFNMTTAGNMFGLAYYSNSCIHSGICNTDASDTNKRVDVGDNSLTTYEFDKLTIKFTNAVPANSTLNNIPIYYNSAPIIDNIINAGDTVEFICDGSNYHLLHSYIDISLKDIDNRLNNKSDSTHTHINESMGQGYTIYNTNITSQNNNAIYACNTNYTPINNDQFIIKFNNDVPANATLNINNTGDYPIYCSTYLNDSRESETISIRSGGIPAITLTYSYVTDIEGMIKSGDIAVVRYLESLNNEKIYYVEFTDTHNNENTISYYTEINNASTNISATIENYTVVHYNYMAIKFTNDVPANATLNINNTGDIHIYYNGSYITDGIIKAGDTAILYYTAIRVIGAIYGYALQYANNENINLEYVKYLNGNYFYDIELDNYTLTTGGIISIKFNNNIYNNGLLNINNTGYKLIYYKGSTITDDIIKAGDTATFIYDGTNYNLISLDRDFTTIDSSLSTTSNNPVQNSVITNALNNKADSIHTHTNESMGFGYGVCGTAASTTDKTVSITDYKLTKGGIVSIKFDYEVLADDTLNINNTGAKPIYYNGSAITANIIKAGDTATFIYDGTNYNLISLDRDFNPITVDSSLSTTSTNPVQNSVITNALNNHTHTNESMGFGFGICTTTTSITAKTVSIPNYKLTNGGIVSIGFDFDVPEDATLNINSTGDKLIYYNYNIYSSDIIKAGDIATFLYSEDNDAYILISLDRNFNFTNESMGFGYGSCSTAALTIDKTVSIPDYTLSNGGIVSIEFDYDVPEDATLNINNTGDKPIYYNGVAITNNIIKAGDTATFIYDGTNYNLISLDRDFNFTNESMGFGYSDANYSCFCGIIDDALTDGDIIICGFDYNVPANATLNINSTGDKPIYYNGSPITDGIIKANDVVILKYNENLDLSFSRFDFIGLYEHYKIDVINLNPQEITIFVPYALTNGQNFNIRFEYDVPANATLNINSGHSINSTGAKPIYYNGSIITDNIIKAGDIATFIYNINDGRYDLLATDNYNNENVNHYYYATTLICYRITLDGYTQTKNGIVSIKFDYDVVPNATLNINNTGAKPIYYNGSAITANIIKVGDIATFIYDGTNYNLISLDRDFNIINESMGFGYGTCSTAASTPLKTVSIPNYKLTKGGIVSIKFDYDVLSGYTTLNINSTGDTPIFYNNAPITDGIIKAGDTATFIYDGIRYNLISLDRDFNDPITVDSSLSTTSNNPVQNSVITNALNNKADNTHTHTNESMGFGYSTCSTAASTTAKTASITNYKLTKNGIVSIRFSYDVPADATLNINNTGDKPIYYNGSAITANIIKARGTATFIYDGTNYRLISLDRDFNSITIDSSLSTTSNNPVQNNVITNALNNYIPTIVGTQIESTNNWTGNAQFETLEDGQRILYYLPYDNSSGSDVVLNLTLADGTTQTGNINCYLSGSTRLNSQYEAGNFIPLIYKENIAFNGSSTTYTGWWAYTDKDIDSKVQNTLNNTTKAYITGTTNNITNIGTQIFDNNVYLGTTAGELNTKSLKLNEKVALNYNNDNNCIDFIFS